MSARAVRWSVRALQGVALCVGAGLQTLAGESAAADAGGAGSVVQASTPLQGLDQKGAGRDQGGAPAAVNGLVASADYWVHHLRDDLAIAQLKKALLIAPSDPTALSRLGQIDVRTGHMAEAAQLLEQLRAHSPQADATRDLDDVYRMAGPDKQKFDAIRREARGNHPEQAIAKLKALFPHGPPTAGALAAGYYEVLAESASDRASAVAALQRLMAQQPDGVEVALALAGLLNRDSSTRMRALQIVQRLAKDPYADRPAVFNVWRRVLRATDGDPAYIEGLNTYLAAVPNDSEFKDLLKVAQGRYKAEEALAADPYWQARQKGLKLLDAGGVAAAPFLEKALQGRSEDPDVLGGLGLVRMRQGRQAEARVLFLKAAGYDKDSPKKWRDLAQAALFWGTLKQGHEAASHGHPAQAERDARAALALQPGEDSAVSLLLDSLLAQKKWSQAEPLLRRQLSRPDVSVDAVRNMVILLRGEGRSQDVAPLMAEMQQRFKGKRQVAFQQLRGAQLADDADALLSQDKLGPAIQTLEESLRYDPGAAWTRYSLARAYSRSGLPQTGRSIMEEGFRRFRTPDMSYATALYRDSQDDTAGAQAALNRVPAAQRSAGMQALDRSLHARRLLASATRAFSQGHASAGARDLQAAAALVPDLPYVLASIGHRWILEGQAERGLAILPTWLVRNASATDPQVDIRLRQGDLLATAGREDELGAWLNSIGRLKGLTSAQTARLDDESLRRLLRLTDTAMADEDYDAAERVLFQASPALRADPRWAMELADLRRSQGRYAEAQAALTPVLAANPKNWDAQLTLARVQEADGEPARALSRVRQVLAQAPADDLDVRLSAVRRLVALRQAREAQAVTMALQQKVGTKSYITVQQGKIQEALGDFDEAKADYQQALGQESSEGVVGGPDGTSAQRALLSLGLRRQPMIEAGVSPSYNSGTPGVSLYHGLIMPTQVRLPQGYYGHWFIHADRVSLDAGTLDTADSYARQSFGTFAALPDGGAHAPVVSSLHTRAQGVALGFGFEADNWRVDLGTTPLGFPVTNIVGGLRLSAPNDWVGLRFNLSRRPVTGSVLSYAGVRDPVTGQTYGGVVQTGLDARVSRDIGRVSTFAQLGAFTYTGRNVQDNQSIKLRTGFTVPIVQARNWRIESGLIGNYWHYAHNLDFYSFGQGGYYSPQRYASIGVPLRWTGRSGALAWDLRGSVGYSNTREADSPFYPTSDRLQQASGNLMHTGGPGSGISYSVGGVLQYNLTRHLAAGVSFSIDRSHDNEPSSAMIYVRYLFNPGPGPVSYPPSAVDPYSDF